MSTKPELVFADLPETISVCVHVPLTPETTNMVNAELLGVVQPGS